MTRTKISYLSLWTFLFCLIGLFYMMGAWTCTVRAGEQAPIDFDTSKKGQVAISIGDQQVAVYYQEDGETIRPFFAHLRAPGAPQVSRNHPPVVGKDRSDHGTYHPGLWMSFGDISGSDYWRLAAPTQHVSYLDEPQGGAGKGTFAVHNHYLDQKDPSKVVCEEDCQFTILVRPVGYLLLWDSKFYGSQEFYFGDQEEMGIGFRVATPIRVETESAGAVPAGNGSMVDSEGRKNGDEIWGNPSDWCDYSGNLDSQRVGITLFCHPDNFRPSWFHARNYGLLEANPFGRDAFGKGEKSKVPVLPGEEFRLRYGILVHASAEDENDGKMDLAAAYADYLKAAGK
jgi:hypothetical protein